MKIIVVLSFILLVPFMISMYFLRDFGEDIHESFKRYTGVDAYLAIKVASAFVFIALFYLFWKALVWKQNKILSFVLIVILTALWFFALIPFI